MAASYFYSKTRGEGLLCNGLAIAATAHDYRHSFLASQEAAEISKAPWRGALSGQVTIQAAFTRAEQS